MKRTTIIILAIVVFLSALGITLYPVISNYVNARYASEIQTSYEEVIEDTNNLLLETVRQSAIRYNESIIPGTA